MSWKVLPRLCESIKKIKKTENCLSAYRWVSFGLALLLFLVGSTGKVSPPLAVGLLLFIFTYNVLLTRYSSYLHHTIRQYPLLLCPDIFICSFLIYLTGGLGSPFYLYAFSPVLVGAVVHRFKGALISSTCSGLLYYLALNLSGYSLSKVSQLGFLNDYIVHVAGFFFVAFFFVIPFNLVDDLERNIEVESLGKKKLLSFYQVSGALSSSLQLSNILNLVVSNAYELVKSERTVLALFKRDHELEIDAKSIVVKDDGEPYMNQMIKSELEGFVQCIVGKDEPIFLTHGSLPQDGSSRISNAKPLICVPLIQKRNYLGLLALVGPSPETSSDDIVLLSVLGNLASCAIENARLVEKTQNLMIMEERNRIARDMHDGLSQSLFSLVLNLEVCIKLMDNQPKLVRQKLVELREFASKNLSETRQYIYNLCPKELENLGLSGALESYTREFTSVNGITAHFEVLGDQKDLSEDMEKALYYITQEALSNARRHANAQNVNVKLKFLRDEIVLSIHDDGHGFDVAEMIKSLEKRKGRGLSNIRKRANIIGAECAIFSQKGCGAKVEVKIPLCSVAS